MELEDPELPSSPEHPEVPTVYRAIINENDLKANRKKSSITKDIKKITRRLGGVEI